MLISNIINLEEVKKSFSYSRACFSKQKIILDRELGKPYVPFSDDLGSKVRFEANQLCLQ